MTFYMQGMIVVLLRNNVSQFELLGIKLQIYYAFGSPGSNCSACVRHRASLLVQHGVDVDDVMYRPDKHCRMWW